MLFQSFIKNDHGASTLRPLDTVGPLLIHLAHKMGMNDFKLKKAYKQLYGTTLFEDFLHARMKKAKSLLEETEQSIVAIAEMAGYKNVSSFSVAFKKYFGQTPGGYRRTS